MATSDRPSGLTALAVIGFILACLLMIQMLFYSGAYVVTEVAEKSGEMGEHDASQVADLQTMVILVLPIMGLCAVLLIVIGVGYIKQKRWSWWVGNLYGVVGFVGFIVVVMKRPVSMGGGKISLDEMSSLFFPLFTLLLLNLVFRRDLTR